MNDSHDGGLLGRITALALILGVAYGVRSIAHGGLSCPLGGCCLLSGSQNVPAPSTPATPAAPAK